MTFMGVVEVVAGTAIGIYGYAIFALLRGTHDKKIAAGFIVACNLSLAIGLRIFGGI